MEQKALCWKLIPPWQLSRRWALLCCESLKNFFQELFKVGMHSLSLIFAGGDQTKFCLICKCAFTNSCLWNAQNSETWWDFFTSRDDQEEKWTLKNLFTHSITVCSFNYVIMTGDRLDVIPASVLWISLMQVTFEGHQGLWDHKFGRTSRPTR